MKIALITGSIFFLLFTVILLFLAYQGVFNKITIQRKNAGPFKLVYEKHIGDYKQSGVIMDKIYYSLLEQDKITTYKGFGIYYDVPGETPAEQLRSIAGCILEKADWNSENVLKDKYNLKVMAESNFIYCEFPYKGKISVIMGIMKVYPALNKYFQQQNITRVPIMEVYDIPGKKIKYYAGTELNKSFFDELLE